MESEYWKKRREREKNKKKDKDKNQDLENERRNKMKKIFIALMLIMSLNLVIAFNQYNLDINNDNTEGVLRYGNDTYDYNGNFFFEMRNGINHGRAEFYFGGDYVILYAEGEPTEIIRWDDHNATWRQYIFKQEVLLRQRINGVELISQVNLSYYVGDYSDMVSLNFEYDNKYFNVWMPSEVIAD